MEDVVHFSQAFATLLAAHLNPSRRPNGVATYPPGLRNQSIRITAKTRPVDWLREVYGLADADYAPRLPVEDNILFVGDVEWWTLEKVLCAKKIHCQAVVSTGATIKQLVDGERVPSADAFYLRLDFDPANLGQWVFPDAIPHVHARPKGEPRFALSRHPAAPHVDFIELILRNFCRPLWDAWAVKVWEKRVARFCPKDTLPQIRTAFRDGKHQLLSTSLGEAVDKWRQALHDEKRRMSPLFPSAGCDIINY